MRGFYFHSIDILLPGTVGVLTTNGIDLTGARKDVIYYIVDVVVVIIIIVGFSDHTHATRS